MGALGVRHGILHAMNLHRRSAIVAIASASAIALAASLYLVVHMPQPTPSTLEVPSLDLEPTLTSSGLSSSAPTRPGTAAATSLSSISNAQTSTSTTTPSVARQLTVLSQDLAMLTPQSISDFNDPDVDAATPLSPTFQKIQNDVVAFFVAKDPDNEDYYSGLLLEAVGQRYILVSLPGPEYNDALIDSLTGNVNDFGLVKSFATSKGLAVYIIDQDIYTYIPDEPTIKALPGAKLPKTETYLSPFDGEFTAPAFTHTDNTVTVAIFNNGGTFALKRYATLALP
jgi:hypothetical protein